MTITDETAEAGRKRAGLIAGLHDLAAFLAASPDVPMPVVTANFRVPAGPREEQLASLDGLARLLGTEVTADGMGTMFAERRFGPVRAEGHVSPGDRTASAYLARAAALRAANAGSPAAA